ncbi:MAG: hypothetical protein V1650_02610 [Candidatus Omnitrophota bacterium]
MPNIRNTIVFIVFVTLCYGALLWNNRAHCLEDRQWGLKLLQDDDRNCYYLRAAWVIDKTIPYKDNFQEYPLLGAYFLALPRLINPTVCQYRIIFTGLMFIIFYVTIYLLSKISKIIDGDYKNIILVMFPSFLWFTANRFDLLPAALSLLSTYLLFRNKYNSAFFVLGLAIMTKWYPIIYAPLFLSYVYANQSNKIEKRVVSFKALFFLLFVIGVICMHAILLSGGKNFFVPYIWHWDRWANADSLLSFLKLPYMTGQRVVIIKWIFFSLQFVSLPLLLMRAIKSKKELIASMAIATVSFIIFAKFNSPQWLLWVSPIMLLINARAVFVLLLLFDLSTFIYFPLGADLSYMWARNYLFFRAMVLLNIIIKFILVFYLCNYLIKLRKIQPILP